MISRSPLLSSALLTGVLLVAPQAEARFGKSSQSSSSESSREETRNSGSNTHDATPVRDSNTTHDASPVGGSRPPPPPQHDSGGSSDDRDDRYQRESRRRGRYYPPRGYYVEPNAPLAYHPSAAVSQDAEEYKRGKNFVFAGHDGSRISVKLPVDEAAAVVATDPAVA